VVIVVAQSIRIRDYAFRQDIGSLLALIIDATVEVVVSFREDFARVRARAGRTPLRRPEIW
jgi:hypothetical protein